MCVCMYINVCVCMHSCLSVSVCMYVCVYICMYECTYVRMYVCVDLCVLWHKLWGGGGPETCPDLKFCDILPNLSIKERW